MTSKPLDVPPYQLQPLIFDAVHGSDWQSPRSPAAPVVEITCAQAWGSEIYVGCSNGELLRFALQADDPSKSESYTVLSRQSLPNDKPVKEIVLAIKISRALILSDHQVHIYSLPSLDPVSSIKPLRNIIGLAVDEQHLLQIPSVPHDSFTTVDPVEFCVIKRNNISLYSLKERLLFQKEVPLPSGATLARRTGHFLCLADKEYYNVVDLERASLVPLLPVSQVQDVIVKPFITVINENEFLIISWTGSGALGVFISGEGDPVRGTLEWPSHPLSVSFDDPYITTLLPNSTIEIHNIETQTIVQVIPAPPSSPRPSSPPMAKTNERKTLMSSLAGFMVPSTARSEKMQMQRVKLLRTQ